MTLSEPAISAHALAKHFGGLVAVDAVSLDVRPGEVVGLLGDNGAGKSTLIKMLSGVYQPDSGTLASGGRTVTFASPREAREAGIETIYQDLALCENLDAAANIFLGREPLRTTWLVLRTVDRRRMAEESQQVLTQLDIRIPDLAQPVRALSGGQRQAVAIARAVYWNARVMIMDEPTAALGVAEQRKVLDLVRTLRARGVGILLISHNLQDVFEVADRVVVMRRGRVVGEREIAQTTTADVLGLMLGAE